jgi:hypothetical protein
LGFIGVVSWFGLCFFGFVYGQIGIGQLQIEQVLFARQM